MEISSTESPALTAIRMTMGHRVAQCVSAAWELRIPDLVAGGPRTANEVARVQVHPGPELELGIEEGRRLSVDEAVSCALQPVH